MVDTYDLNGNLKVLDSSTLEARQNNGRPKTESSFNGTSLSPVALTTVDTAYQIEVFQPSTGYTATLDTIDVSYMSITNPLITDKAVVMVLIDQNINGINPMVFLGVVSNANPNFSPNVKGIKVYAGGSVTVTGIPKNSGYAVCSINATEEQDS